MKRRIKERKKELPWGIMGLTILLPFAVNPHGASVVLGKYVLGTIGAPFILGIWFLRVKKELLLPKRISLYAALGTLGALTLLSAIISPYKYAALVELLRIESGLILIFTAYVTLGKEYSKTYFKLAGLMAVLVSVHAIIQGFGIDIWGWSRPLGTGSFATFGHPNFMADYLLVLLFPTSGFAFWELKNKRKPWWIAGTLLIAIALVLSQSSGAILGLTFGIWIWALWLSPRKVRIPLGIAGILAGLGAPWIALATKQGQFFLQSNLFRIETWRGAWRILLENPLLGAGLGTFPILFPAYRIPDFIRRFRYAENLLHAHCEFLEMGSEQGILGLGALLFLIIIVGILAIRRTRILHRSTQILCTGAFAGLVAALVHNTVCVNLRWAGPWFSFCLTLGAALALLDGTQKGEVSTSHIKVSRSTAQVTGIILILIAGGALWMGSTRLASNKAYYKGMGLLSNNDETPAVSALKQALQDNPHNIAARYDLAYVLSNAGRHKEALKEYELILQESPNYQRIHRNMGVSFLSERRYQEACKALDSALKVNTEEANYYMRAFAANMTSAPDTLDRYLAFFEIALKFLRQIHLNQRKAPPGLSQVVPHEYVRIKAWCQDGLGTLELLIESYPPIKQRDIWKTLGRNRVGDGLVPALLGNYHKKLSHWAEARDYYQEALLLEPDNEDALQGLRDFEIRNVN